MRTIWVIAYGKSRTEARQINGGNGGSSGPSWREIAAGTEVARTSAQRDAIASLFDPHGAELPGLDQALRAVPWHGSIQGSVFSEKAKEPLIFAHPR